MSNDHCFCGLLVRPLPPIQPAPGPRPSFLPLPLGSVSVKARAFDLSAEVIVTQQFRNDTPHILESEYVFPLDENAAVVGFVAELNGRRLHGMVKEKAQAKTEFEQAQKAGYTAALMDQKHENIFKQRIANLPPHSTINIILTYLTTFDLEGSANHRFVIPAVVAPRYEPHQYWGRHEDDKNRAYQDKSHQVISGPIGNILPVPPSGIDFLDSMSGAASPPQSQPVIPLAPDNNPTSLVSVPQNAVEAKSLSMEIDFFVPFEILRIDTPTHADQTTINIDPLDPSQVIQAQQQEPGANTKVRLSRPHHGRVTFGGSSGNLGGKDFVVRIFPREVFDARAILEVDPTTGSQAIQVVFIPTEIDLMDASQLQTEIIFLIDRSGSMGGDSINAVRQTLHLFLKSLPCVCRFNIVGFGSNFKKLFDHAELYNESTLARATAYANSMQADMGGTEILKPLEYCFTAATTAGYPRQIFLLTDGQVGNVQQLIDATHAHTSTARLFTFGIGSGVDRHLVKSLAKAGRGTCEFVTHIDSSPQTRAELNTKVMRSLVRALQPSLSNIKIHWQEAIDQAKEAFNKSNTPFTMPPPVECAAAGGEQAKSGGFFSKLFGSNQKDARSTTLQCPNVIPPIFPPSRELVYMLHGQFPIPNAPAEGEGSSASEALADRIVHLRVTAESNKPTADGKLTGKLEWFLPLNLSKPQYGQFIHKLAARARIGEIQNATTSEGRFRLSDGTKMTAEQQKAMVLSLALPYQLMSNYTSFIVVDDRKVKGADRLQAQRPAADQTRRQEQVNAQLNAFNQFITNQSQPLQTVNAQGYAVESVGDASGNSSPSGSASQSSVPSAPPGESASDDIEFEAEGEIVTRLEKPPFSGGRGMRFGGFGGPSLKPGFSFGAATGGGRGTFTFASASSCAPAPGSAIAPAPTCTPSAALHSFGQAALKPARKRCETRERRAAAPMRQQQQPQDVLCMSLSMQSDDADFGATPMAIGSESEADSHDSSKNMAEATATSTNLDGAFSRLLQLAGVDGCWNLDAAFLQLLQQSVHAAKSDAAKTVDAFTLSSLNSLAAGLTLQPKALASILALWLLQTCFADRQSEWLMIAGKATMTLRNTLNVKPDDIHTLTKQIIKA